MAIGAEVRAFVFGAAVFGVEALPLAEWLVKPVLGGVVALGFWQVQRQLARAQDAKAAVEKKREDIETRRDQMLAGLRTDIDRRWTECDAANAAVGSRVGALEARHENLSDDHKQRHNRWNNTLARLEGSLNATAAKADAAHTIAVETRATLAAMEKSHG